MVLVMFARLTPETEAGGTETLKANKLRPLLLDDGKVGTIGSPSDMLSPLRISGGDGGDKKHRRNSSLHLTSPQNRMNVRGHSPSNSLSLSSSSFAPHELWRKSRRESETEPLHPYGIPALLRVFKFLARSINPKNSKETRELCLRLIRVVFETAGRHIGSFPELLQVIHDDLCKHILQNTQTTDLTVLSLTLRIVFDLFNSVKKHLKVQLEVFLTSIHLRIVESETAAFDQKQLVLESLVEFCKEPALIVGLYRNYDCEVSFTNLYEDLCKFLSKSAIPSIDSPKLTDLHLLSVEALLAVLDSIAGRFVDVQDSGMYASDGTESPLFGSSSSPAPPNGNGVVGSGSSSNMDMDDDSELTRSRERKKKLQLAVQHFNKDGKKSFKYLQALKVLDDPLTPQSVVRFFKENAKLDKTQVGEFLGGEKEFNLETLAAYVESFDFKPTGNSVSPTAAASSSSGTRREGMGEGAHDIAQPPTSSSSSSSTSSSTSSSALPTTSPSGIDKPPSSSTMNTTSAVAGAPDSQSMTSSTSTNGLVDGNGNTQAEQLRIDECMRIFLEGFRLPGEAQKIARIMEAFAQRVFEHCPGPFKSADAAYVTAYSIIMLNTDAHNDQVKRKMEKEQFVRNNRGINEGEDLPYEYLSAIYDTIIHNEIRLTPDELEISEDGFNDKKWSFLVRQSRTSGHFQTHAPRIHGREMFLIVWQNTLHMFNYYLLHGPSQESRDESDSQNASDVPYLRDDGKMLAKMSDAVNTFSRICAVYDLNDIFNNLVITIANVTAQRLASLCSTFSDDRQRMVEFGRDVHTHSLCSLLFNLVLSYSESHILEAWSNVMQVVLWLQKVGALPSSLTEMDDFRDAAGKPLKSVRILALERAREQVESSGGSFFSAFTSLWGSSSTPSYEEPVTLSHPSSVGRETRDGVNDVTSLEEKELISTGRMVIEACRIGDMIHNSRFFQPEPLNHLTKALDTTMVLVFQRITSGSNKALATNDAYPEALINEDVSLFYFFSSFVLISFSCYSPHPFISSLFLLCSLYLYLFLLLFMCVLPLSPPPHLYLPSHTRMSHTAPPPLHLQIPGRCLLSGALL